MRKKLGLQQDANEFKMYILEEVRKQVTSLYIYIYISAFIRGGRKKERELMIRRTLLVD